MTKLWTIMRSKGENDPETCNLAFLEFVEAKEFVESDARESGARAVRWLPSNETDVHSVQTDNGYFYVVSRIEADCIADGTETIQ